MRTGIKILGVASALAALFLSAPGGSMGRPPAPDGPQIIWQPAKDQWDYTSELGIYKVMWDVQKKLDDINSIDTSAGLSEKAIDALVNLHGNNGTMTDKAGDIHGGGKANIKKYLDKLAEAKVKNYKIRLELVYATEFTDVYKNGINGKKEDSQIIHNLIFIFSNSFETSDAVADPPSTATCKHSRVCDCIGY